MTVNPSTPRFASALKPLVTLAVLAAALVVPSQTLAEAHRGACPTHAGTRHRAHACGHSRAGKTRQASKHHHGHALATTLPGTLPAPAPPASCEDGSAPVRAGSRSFSCGDGSEPECEDGSAPTPSRDGHSLVCALATEDRSEPSGEAECEEGPDSACVTVPGSSEQTCEASSSASSDFVCE